jgi:YkgG family uncharacterized protein
LHRQRSRAGVTAVVGPTGRELVDGIAVDPGAVDRVATALRAHNVEAIIVDTAAEVRDTVLAMIPDGAEVHWGKSRALEETGVIEALMETGRYDAIRPRVFKMDRETEAREIRKLSAAPDIMLGSVNAVTEEGALVEASATGSQLAGYAYGGGHLILVVGSQKIVPNVEAALERIGEVVYPWENAQVRDRLGRDTIVAKVLIIFGEWMPGRTTVVLVREPVGI